jgi:hypothetical protein
VRRMRRCTAFAAFALATGAQNSMGFAPSDFRFRRRSACRWKCRRRRSISGQAARNCSFELSKNVFGLVGTGTRMRQLRMCTCVHILKCRVFKKGFSQIEKKLNYVKDRAAEALASFLIAFVTRNTRIHNNFCGCTSRDRLTQRRRERGGRDRRSDGRRTVSAATLAK